MPQAPPEDFDWSKLGFTTRSTAGMVVCTWRTGSWSAPEVQESRCLEVDALASGLQYGQSCFEGLKAFRSVTDAKIRIFRPDLNAKRLQRSCAACCMPAPSADLFLRMLRQAVQLNSKWVPPAACGGSLYIRPFVFGSGPELGLLPPAEFKFVILVNPVGAFYPNGISQGVPALIKLGYDRAAPCGTGSVKLAGNYAPTYGPSTYAKERGYTVLLFLDAKTNSYIEEFATSNFAAIRCTDGQPTYITPASPSILPSVTNRSLYELARDYFGWRVERRPVPWTEVASFDEVVACGTAVVITPISRIDRELPVSCTVVGDDEWSQREEWTTTLESVSIGDCSYFKQLMEVYKQIQSGAVEDKFGWMYPPEGIDA